MTSERDPTVRGPVRSFDPVTGPDLLDPHACLRLARRRSPVFFSPQLQTWVVTRYDDVAGVLTRPETFSSASSITNVPAPPPQAVLDVLMTGIPYEGGLVDMDPPQHTDVRQLFKPAFQPSRMVAMEDDIRALARRLVERLPGPPADLVRGFAHPLPVLVIANLFRVREPDLADFTRWCDEWVVLNAQHMPTERLVAAARAVVDFQHYIADLIEDRRRNLLPDDLLSDVLRADAGSGRRIRTHALVGVVMTILLAGHETTSELITNTVYQLCKHPTVLAQVAARPELVPAVLAEVLRFDPPVPWMYRTATTATEVGGVALPAGAHLQLSFASANRDEDVFDDPDTFTVGRPNSGAHFGLGRGIHYCLGSSLALVEARVAVATVIEHLAGIRLADGFERVAVQSATFRTTPALLVVW